MAGSSPDEDAAVEEPLELSVVLCVHNGAATMRTQLDALAEQDWEGSWEVVVVDHASTDATAEIAAAHARRHPRTRVVTAPAGGGLSRARNVGVGAARGHSVAFCDDDDRVGEGWVSAIGAALREHPLVASRLDYDELNDRPRRTGRGAYQSSGIETLFGTPVVNGAGSGWSRHLWSALGGSDESLVFTGEDIDLALRAHRDEGVEAVFVGDAEYHYRRRHDARETWRQARRYGRAQVWLYRSYGQGCGEDQPVSVAVALRQWAWLVKHLGDLRDGDRRTAWAWRAGLRVGRAEGCARERIWYP